ncbi:apolipoprotein D-like [Pollicipes pollicipes]|uniref:apolipoprotein D-like n=1 Tax=Pollicipes pollicipes TaxID=41117 RepID=UPI0018855868|nr:apolipoprotein D-like [Pollicipes pollicipes]
MALLAVILWASALGPLAAGHLYAMKRCPNPTPVESFDQSRVLGMWKVEWAVKTTSSCMEFEFKEEGDAFKVYEFKELSASEKAGVEIKYGSVGTLTRTGTPGFYKASYSTSKISGRFVILDTDYESYLVVLHCMQLGPLGSRRTIYVLSKGGTPISSAVLDQVKGRLPNLGMRSEQLAQVSHENCVSRETADIDLTGTVDTGDIVDAAKKVISLGGSVAKLFEVISMLG